MRLHFLAFLLFPLARASVTLIDDARVIATVGSHDYFQLPTPFFNRTGLPVFITYEHTPAADCSLGFKAVGNTTLAKESILVLDMASAYVCKLRTFGDTFRALGDYNAKLAAAKLPPTKTCVILMWSKDTPVPGDPADEPYITHRPRHSDQYPPAGLDVAIVNMDEVARLRPATMNSGSRRIEWNVMQTPGEWNPLYSSPGYRWYVYGITAADALLVLAGVGGLVRNSRKQGTVFNLRNAIVVLTTLSVILFATCILLPIYSYPPIILDATASLLIHNAFYLLLILWIWLVKRVEARFRRSAALMQWATLFSIFVTLVRFVLIVLQYSISTGDTFDSLMTVVNLVYNATRAFLALVFAVFLIYFTAKRRSIGKVSQTTSDTLRRLGHLALVAFLTFLVIAGCQLVLILHDRLSARTTFILFCVRSFMGILREAALLLVLCVA